MLRQHSLSSQSQGHDQEQQHRRHAGADQAGILAVRGEKATGSHRPSAGMPCGRRVAELLRVTGAGYNGDILDRPIALLLAV